jgi:predicted signal transduction protein with EAL and GGDEF domain
VLAEMGNRLRHCVRAHDAVVRWGGDEFVVLVESLRDPGESPFLADRVVRVLAEPVSYGGHRFELGASVGVAVAEASDPVSAVGLLVRADAAMYRAKTGGGHAWSMFDEELRARGARREHLETLVDRAVPERRVELHYQPIVDVRTTRVVGAEALLRLRDEDRSLVSPLEFLAFAEESGAIVPLEQEVLRQACADCTSWREQGHDLSIAVNLSAHQLSHMDDLEVLLREVLTDTGLPPDRLTCEVTEHSLTDTGRGTREGIARLVRSGLHFSVDDFGTGYNSLTYLRLLPVQEIKVDQSFLAGAIADPLSRAIVTAISSLAQDIGIRCVAEGVEDLAQHELLLDLGIPYAQGYLYGRPVPYEEFTALL